MSRCRWMLAACLATTALAATEEPPVLTEVTAEQGSAPDSGEPPNAIPQHHLNAYFAERPKTFLLDPQRLLDAHATREQLAELAAHAADSPIDLFIYVFGKDQQLPGKMRADDVLGRCFTAGRPAVIGFYFLGQPRHSALHLSPALAAVVPPANQRRAQEVAITAASDQPEPYQQLAAFTTQLGIQIYSMERLLDRHQATVADPHSAARSHHAKPAKKTSAVAALIERWQPAVAAYWQHGAATLAAIVAALGLGWWWRWRATYRFPEFPVEPRLGGSQAAGIGAVISFASPALPPASQRHQLPGSRRRCSLKL